MKRDASTGEADFKTACGWWPDLPNVWTPLGWRDHMHRFSVLWNGSVLVLPDPNSASRTARWRGQDLHLSLVPSRDGAVPGEYTAGMTCRRADDGMVRQGWTADAAPVLWTEWAVDGLALRAEMVGHIAGGGAVERGDEPLFAWIRLRVQDLCRPLPMEEAYGFLLLLESPQVRTTMSQRNFTVAPGFHPYSKELRAEPAAPVPAEGCLVLEPDGRVRAGVAPGSAARVVRLDPPDGKVNCHRLYVQLPARKGAFVDVLLPMLACERAAFDRELALGREGARREANRFWKRQLKTAVRFETPEADVNDVLRQSVRFSLNLTERNPDTGKYCKVNGSWVYAALWTTPGAMDLIMLLDALGHHDAAGRYLEIFREEQGTVTPPGDGYAPHPGYYSTPALYKSIDWLSDNGAVLWTIAMHALLSGDKAFAARFAESMIRSCEWIRENRARTDHGGYRGVLPAAVATDAQTKIQSVWSAGWNHLGLCAAVRVLERLGHPRAAEFAAEAAAYRTDYAAALRDKCRTMPEWKDARGRARQFVPMALIGDKPAESRHGFYLDAGPLFHVFAGLLPADDPLMRDTLAWFREGPQHRFYRHDANCWQVPVLDHEMSSCEPCYSWNVFHAWQLGDRAKFLEGMYSVFAGSVSRKTRISCETRGGVTGNVFSAPLGAWLARLAVVDDALRENELHLLRLAPLAWLKPGSAGRYEAVPTVYGPVTLSTKVSADGRTLDVAFRPRFRTPPARVTLHVPPLEGLKAVRVNGKAVKPRAGRVEWPLK